MGILVINHCAGSCNLRTTISIYQRFRVSTVAYIALPYPHISGYVAYSLYYNAYYMLLYHSSSSQTLYPEPSSAVPQAARGDPTVLY